MPEANISNDQLLAASLTRVVMSQSTDEDLERVQKRLQENEKGVLRVCRSNLILVRALTRLQRLGTPLAPSTLEALAEEQSRVEAGIRLISEVSDLLTGEGFDFMVIKTMDHYPDQGHDIDVFIADGLDRFEESLAKRFSFNSASRSMCDHLAGKMNFRIEDATLEVHSQVLGQVGEHKKLPAEMLRLRQRDSVEGQTLFVPSPEGRILLAILQRMYRHFNFRICDIVNLIGLLEDESTDRSLLQNLASSAGLGHGVVAGLAMVRALAEDLGLRLSEAESWGAHTEPPDRLVFQRGFFRFSLSKVVPPTYARLFGSSLKRASVRQASRLTVLLTLLPLVGINIRLFPGFPVWRKLW